MSRYNHSEFLKNDFVGELHFALLKVLKTIYVCMTTFLARVDLKAGGGEIWRELEGSRRCYNRALSVQLNRDW